MKITGLVLATSISLLTEPGLLFAQAGAGATVKLDRAALSPEVSNDQREVLVPGAGKQFLWVAATLSGAPQVVDLTKVTLVSGPDKASLIGVDSAFGGEAKQFSMIAQAHSKDGKVLEPLEETRSVGSIGFAFTPGKSAVLKVNVPPQSFCLLFIVPKAFRTGTISGLGAKALQLPALAAKP
jgi:hypothetical protein